MAYTELFHFSCIFDCFFSGHQGHEKDRRMNERKSDLSLSHLPCLFFGLLTILYFRHHRKCLYKAEQMVEGLIKKACSHRQSIKHVCSLSEVSSTFRLIKINDFESSLNNRLQFSHHVSSLKLIKA